MTKEEVKQEAEKKYCNGCKWRIEQCLWAWRNTNGLNEPNEKNCSCKEVPAYITGAEPREKRIAELEHKLEQTEKDLADYQFNYPTIKELEAEVKEWKDKADLWCKTANLKDHNIMINKELEKENAELKEELKKWKDEWQEQVQKATDEGYARTLQTMQLTKAKKIIKELCGMVRELNKPNVQLTNVDYSLSEAEQFLNSEVEK